MPFEDGTRTCRELLEAPERPTDVLRKDTNPKDAQAGTKVPLHLVPRTAITAMAMAFCEGGLKYGPYNWRESGVRASVYVAAMQRHMSAWFDGEDIDPDSGLSHVWKAMACLAIIVDAEACGKLNDDRPPPVGTGESLRRLESIVASLQEKLG